LDRPRAWHLMQLASKIGWMSRRKTILPEAGGGND
jgi:hypothetical protein